MSHDLTRYQESESIIYMSINTRKRRRASPEILSNLDLDPLYGVYIVRISPIFQPIVSPANTSPRHQKAVRSALYVKRCEAAELVSPGPPPLAQIKRDFSRKDINTTTPSLYLQNRKVTAVPSLIFDPDNNETGKGHVVYVSYVGAASLPCARPFFLQRNVR